MAKESKPLPNDQKIVLNRINACQEIRLLKYESNTVIVFVGIRYPVRDLLSNLNKYG